MLNRCYLSWVDLEYIELILLVVLQSQVWWYTFVITALRRPRYRIKSSRSVWEVYSKILSVYSSLTLPTSLLTPSPPQKKTHWKLSLKICQKNLVFKVFLDFVITNEIIHSIPFIWCLQTAFLVIYYFDLYSWKSVTNEMSFDAWIIFGVYYIQLE